jgi:hypothetical protein
MKNFLKYLLIEVMNKYGSFMWFGTHVSLTQTNWHYLFEIFLSLTINFLVVFSLYLQYNEKLQETNNT